MLKRLIQLFIRTNGRKPNNLEMILLKQKATKQAVDERKIVSMVDRQPVNPNKPILGGMNVPETESEILKRIKNQNKEAVKNWPEKKAYGGIAGMLGEPTYADDNHRVPYDSGNMVLPKEKPTALHWLDTLNSKAAYNTLGPRTYFEKVAKFATEAKDKGDISNRQFMEIMQPFFGKGGETLTRKIDEEREYLDEYQTGGRVPFKKGHSAGRRNFLKGIAALATVPIIGKYFKWAKPLAKSSKVLTSVPIKDISGMPAWFKPLVNKVIKEGKEIESGAERVITHKTKLPNSKTDVYVEQDLVSGDVSVQIGTGKHGWSSGQHGQPVSLQYTAPQHYPTHTEAAKIDAFRKPATSSDLGHFRGTQDLSNKKTKPEFWVEEAEFTGGHPENIKFEESTFEKFGEHGSDFSEVEMFATGKVKKVKPTKKAEKTEFESGKAEADAERYWEEHGDYASGGRVPSSGGLAGMLGE